MRNIGCVALLLSAILCSIGDAHACAKFEKSWQDFYTVGVREYVCEGDDAVMLHFEWLPDEKAVGLKVDASGYPNHRGLAFTFGQFYLGQEVVTSSLGRFPQFGLSPGQLKYETRVVMDDGDWERLNAAARRERAGNPETMLRFRFIAVRPGID